MRRYAPDVQFSKGHGTENDFIVIPDLDGDLPLEPEQVRRICDRRAGLGADGVLRVVRSSNDPDATPLAADAPWFMDYRNADGSAAQMCGNGVRVYARYLVDSGLAAPGHLRLATRHGIREVDVPATGDVTVDMGRAVVGEPVDIDGEQATFVDMGNPHAVVEVDAVATLGVLAPRRLDLNVEYVEIVGPAHLRMRVHERGVGETRSCGTGSCAAVVAVTVGHDTPRDVAHTVDVPGGRLSVTWCADGRVLLSGPAVLVASGELRSDWLAGPP